MRRIDRRRFEVRPGELLCVICVRNERLRLPYTLDYHRRLGVDRFLIVDNLSDDGSTEMLLAESDVHVFVAEERYSESGYGVQWINSLLDAYAVDHWALTVDADELLVYPGCEKLSLQDLTAHLDGRGEQALLTFLLDMYSDRQIRETLYTTGRPFLDSCPYFDVDSYSWEPTNETRGRVPSRGGPRDRVFWAGNDRGRPAPFLPKIPLVRWRRGLAYQASTHVLPGVRVSAMTGVLMHFKFFSDFTDRVAEEAVRGEHWQDAGQYGVYRKVLEENPGLNMHYRQSVRYEDSQQLVDLGLMHTPSSP